MCIENTNKTPVIPMFPKPRSIIPIFFGHGAVVPIISIIPMILDPCAIILIFLEL